MAKTYSRYDYMTQGVTTDEVSGSLYPDPLSLNYNELSLTALPEKATLSAQDIIFMWREVEDIYGIASYDDMVLTLNGIPHRNFLTPGHQMYFPSLNDIETSFAKGR